MSTSVNHHSHEEIMRQLTWAHVDVEGNLLIDYSNDEDYFATIVEDEVNTPSLIKDFFDKGMQCNIKGTLEVTKVTGQLTFTINSHHKAVRKFLEENTDAKFQVNHVVNSMTFGDTKHHEDI